jgi:hypothetical protein
MEQLLYYQHSSYVTDDRGGELVLAAAQNEQSKALFFNGKLNYPQQTARCLRAISNLVGSHFYTPPAMLQRILREADPVITVGRQILRFEGFSGCCSAYARLDIMPTGYQAEHMVPGTTNVDFQAPMRAALSKVRSDDQLNLCIGGQGIELIGDNSRVIEKKVDLPRRWVKGFSQLQSMQLGLQRQFCINASAALRFIRQLPKGAQRHVSYIVPGANGLRLSTRQGQNSIGLKGVERLRVLENILTCADTLSAYADEQQQLSVWVVTLIGQRFTLVVSAEPWRGFSGEGQLLTTLVKRCSELALAQVKAQLHWQDAIIPDQLATQLALPQADIDVALALLATHGLLGYDMTEQCYFHRKLPFISESIDKLNPRLKAASQLVADEAVEYVVADNSYNFSVKSADISHFVSLSADVEKCSCPWYAKYGNKRGPCKHILAAFMLLEAQGKSIEQ